MNQKKWIKIKPGCDLPGESSEVLFGVRANGKETIKVALYHTGEQQFYIPAWEGSTTLERILNSPPRYEFFWKSVEKLPQGETE